MNKLLICLIAVLFFSCKTSFQMTTTTVNFENYNRDGFLITTSSIGSDYKSLGLVDVSCQTGFVPSKTNPEKKIVKEDAIFGSPAPALTDEYFYCTKTDLIDAIYSQAKGLKANAIIDLKFSEYTIKTKSGSKVVFTATGLAVKIK